MTAAHSNKRTRSSNANLPPVIIIRDDALTGREAETQRLLIARVETYCKTHGRNVSCVGHEEMPAAIENARLAERLQSTCYLGGARLGNDPELAGQVTALSQAVTQAGFHTVYPGSADGMMGILANAVLAEGKPLTSIFSLPVAAASVEELEMRATSILVFPDETRRQIGYHSLSSSQIALPGGTGTGAEASIHFYKNLAMDYFYRHPDIFKPDGVASPIIYYSPKTAKVVEEFKRVVAATLSNRAVSEAILRTPASEIDVGYWSARCAQFKIKEALQFLPPEQRLFIAEARTPDAVVEELRLWSDPFTRQQAIAAANTHFATARRNIASLHRNRGIFRAPAG